MQVVGDASTGHDVVDEFLLAARAYPERPAIIRNGRELSYADLAALVRAVAQRLGTRPGIVGVHATHSPGTIAGLLGVWAAGGTYCPVDPAFPAKRREAMLAAAGCRTVLDAGPQPKSAADGVLARAGQLPVRGGRAASRVRTPGDHRGRGGQPGPAGRLVRAARRARPSGQHLRVYRDDAHHPRDRPAWTARGAPAGPGIPGTDRPAAAARAGTRHRRGRVADRRAVARGRGPRPAGGPRCPGRGRRRAPGLPYRRPGPPA